MKPKFSLSERERILRRFVINRENITQVCREAGISRTLFYRWLGRYKDRIQFKNLKKISTQKETVRMSVKPKKGSFTKYSRFPINIRIQAINDVRNQKKSVVKVCQELNISKTIFYRWLRRYKDAGYGVIPAKAGIQSTTLKLDGIHGLTRDDKFRFDEHAALGALEDKKPFIVRFPNQIPEKYEQLILDAVAQYPQLSSHKLTQVLPTIGNRPVVGHHGVQNVLRRNNLTTYEKRLAYAQEQAKLPFVFIPALRPIILILLKIFQLPLKTRSRLVAFLTAFFIPIASSVVVLGIISYLRMFIEAPSVVTGIGYFFSSIALMFGFFFLLYSWKYYFSVVLILVFSRQELTKEGKDKLGNYSSFTGKPGLMPDVSQIRLERHPFVSIHLPLYNEKRVVNRLLEAVTSMDYDSFEVIICDDSTDETKDIVNEWRNHPKIKISHRETREGFKGGALREALTLMDPRTEFILVFDADFLPYPDTITQFLKYFQVSAGTLDFTQAVSFDLASFDSAQDKQDKSFQREALNPSPIAAIQGYQWHVLNKSENWITRGVRSEYAGSYVIERSSAEIYGGLKQIAGSVYMIRADILKKYDWGNSITEDFELTLKLYRDGYKVIYTPYVQTPSECVSTLKRLVRQRMRWAEGHSHNIKKMFTQVLTSSRTSRSEKLEFIYLAPYYLQSAFFLAGTCAWFLAEAVFQVRLPFWTEVWGWSLVLTNMLSLPLMNLVGMFLEEAEEKDYLGLFSFIVITYIITPFQAYAAIKGFLESKEGPWFRTPKTGRITDVFRRGRFYRWLSEIFPSRDAVPASPLLRVVNKQRKPLNHYPFQTFPFGRKKIRWIGNLVLVLFLLSILLLGGFAPLIPQGSIDVSAKERQFAILSESDTVDGTNSLQRDSEEEITEPILVQFVAGGGNYLEYIFYPEPRVRTKLSDKEIEMTLNSAEGLGIANPKKLIKHNGKFIYQNMWQNIDLQFIPQKGKLTEAVILKAFGDIGSLNYDLKLVGLEPALFEGEVILANQAGGPGLFAFTKPYMYEENRPEEKNFGISYKLEKKTIGWELKKELTPDGKKWLSDPSRLFPVVIDPTQVTLVIQGSLNATETQFSSVQRKIAYSARGAETDAWYAVYEEATGVDVFWTRCLVPCDGSTNSWGTDTEMDDEASEDDESPTLWMEGTTLYAAWFDNGSDGPKWRSWETAAEPETANQNACQADDVGTVGAGLVSIAVADDGEVYTAQITDGQAAAEITISKSTSACSNSDLSSNGTVGGLTQGDAHAMVTIGNNLLLVYNDGDLSASSYVDDGTPAWDQTNIDVNGGAGANAEEDFSVTTDGTDVWVLQAISTTDTELWKCEACNLSSQSWGSKTAPFTGFTNGSDVSISYISGSNILVAMSLQGSGTGEQVHWKTSTDEGVNWSGDNTYGFAAGASGLDRLSSTLSGADNGQIAATVLETTNSEWEFSTLPEKFLVLLIALPLLSKFINFRKRRKRYYPDDG